MGHSLFAPDGSVRLISFSKLSVHECEGGTPLLYQEGPGEVPRGCEELFQTEVRMAWRCGCLSRTRLQHGWKNDIRPEGLHEVDLADMLSAVNLYDVE